MRQKAQPSKSVVKPDSDNNNQSHPPKKFFQVSTIYVTESQIRKAIDKMRALSRKPDMDGNLRFLQGHGWVDERDFWLLGKLEVKESLTENAGTAEFLFLQ